ncbi:lysoplasmalogenase [Paraglaciecola aestuariivivens]
MPNYFSIGYLLLSTLYFVGLAYQLPLQWLLKVLPIALLILAVIKTSHLNTAKVLFIALVFSGCGDLLLAFDKFIPGLIAFLCAQLSFAYLFYTLHKNIWHRWQWSLLLLFYMILMLIWLLGQLGTLLYPVLAYMTAIGCMGLLAIQSKLSMRGAVMGALVFILSDSFIAINKFIMPLPLASYLIMTSYYLAQYLLLRGFLSAPAHLTKS